VRSPLAPESDLVFAWNEQGRRRAAIAGFLFGSLILHALCFYAFQIVYPPTVALLPPPGRVTLIAPNTVEGRVLLRWLEAEDPALASTTQPPDQEALTIPTVQHAPSYQMHRPALKEAPFVTPDLGMPSANPPGPVEPLRLPFQTATQPSPTVVRFSAELETVSPAQIPRMKFSASGHEPPRATEFRVAVSEKGEIRYCFLEISSGDVALDEQARKYLMLFRLYDLRMPPAEVGNYTVWGTATIDWGNDIIVPPLATGSAAP
jgi:hypothetical protein